MNGKINEKMLVEPRDNLILLGIASAHKYLGSLVSKSPIASKHIIHKKREHARKEIKDITFLLASYSSLFIPLSCISVSVLGLKLSGKPCRKWLFKPSYHFLTYRYPF